MRALQEATISAVKDGVWIEEGRKTHWQNKDCHKHKFSEVNYVHLVFYS